MAAENWEIVRHRAAIAGRVTDAGTGRPLPGARIEITAGPQPFTARLALLARQHGNRWEAMAERPDRTRTATDGFFRFLDLPAGQYTLSAALPGAGSRYGTVSVQVTLTANGEGNVSVQTAALALPATTVKGRVSGPSDTAVQMAEVRVQGSGERTWSDAEGRYVLSGVEAGSRKLTIAARGFASKSETVALGQPGAVVIRDVTLSSP